MITLIKMSCGYDQLIDLPGKGVRDVFLETDATTDHEAKVLVPLE